MNNKTKTKNGLTFNWANTPSNLGSKN